MKRVSSPALYCIGAGPLGLRTLRLARELGLRLVVTDKNANAPGFQLADECHVVDGCDVKAHLEIAKATKERVVAVLCGAEFGARVVQSLRAHFNLPHNHPEAVLRVLDKEEMKLAFLSHGVPTPQGAVVESAGELLELLQSSERVIVKPLGGSGSRGVSVVESGANVRAVFEATLASVPDERALLVEPFVVGRSIDINGLMVEGTLHPAGLLEKYSSPLPTRLPVGGNDPAQLTDNQVQNAYELLEQAAHAVGLLTGPIKGDFILGASGFQVLEVGARFHGDVTTAGTLPYGSGIEPVRAYLKWCLGDAFASDLTPPATPGYAAWRVLALPPGKLVQQPEQVRLGDHPGLGLVWHRFRVGDRIEPYGDTTKIPGYITAHGSSQEEAEAALTAWFGDQDYVVQVDRSCAAWYARLVEEFRSIGLNPVCSGVPDWAL